MLRLDGTYRPPLAAFGAGLDRTVLHMVAAACAWPGAVTPRVRTRLSTRLAGAGGVWTLIMGSGTGLPGMVLRTGVKCRARPICAVHT